MYYFQMLLNGLSLGAVYAIIALGFTLIYSILKFSNFSHGGIMVVCAYFAYVIQRRFQLNFVSMMLITAAFGAILACLVQFVGFENLRAKRSNIMLYFVSSSTLGVLLQNIIVITFSSTYYAYPAFFTPAVCGSERIHLFCIGYDYAGNFSGCHYCVNVSFIPDPPGYFDQSAVNGQ